MVESDSSTKNLPQQTRTELHFFRSWKPESTGTTSHNLLHYTIDRATEKQYAMRQCMTFLAIVRIAESTSLVEKPVEEKKIKKIYPGMLACCVLAPAFACNKTY
jgi:hypothetical protein